MPAIPWAPLHLHEGLQSEGTHTESTVETPTEGMHRPIPPSTVQRGQTTVAREEFVSGASHAYVQGHRSAMAASRPSCMKVSSLVRRQYKGTWQSHMMTTVRASGSQP